MNKFEWLHKIMKNRILMSVLGMIVGSIIYCFSIVFVLGLGKFYAGGLTGISQIIADIFSLPWLKSVCIGLFNVPLFILGWRGVSKRFAVLTLSSVLLQMLLIYLFDIAFAHGFNPFEVLTKGDTIVLSVLGGLLCGAGCGITLRSGSSTGGLDIVSQSFSLKTGIPFTVISGTVDTIIIVSGAIVGKSISVAVYTIIRLIIQVLTLDKIHTIYNFQKITIITTKKDELKSELLNDFKHGVTMYPAIGGYTGEQKWVFETIVMTYEVQDYYPIIKRIDPHAFVSYIAVKGVLGNYKKNAIS